MLFFLLYWKICFIFAVTNLKQMKQVTKELSKISGIYCIENKINHKVYIGSSKNLYQRLLKHFALLRHNKHENVHLQNAWNKYGEDSFEWTIIEFCDKSILTEREQYCIDLFNAEYNITKKVIKNILSKESRIKQGETRKRLHKEGKLEWNFNPITIYIYDLDGELLFVNPNGIKGTAEKLNISPSSICRVLNGTYQQCKGYRFSYKLEKLSPLTITSQKQNTKYSNYRHCRIVGKPII